MSKLERIAAFIAVVEQRGFAAAARKEGVSTAAMSKQVTRLESDLNVTLLQRTTRQVTLTEAGSAYYQQAKKTLVALSEIETSLAHSQSEPAGLLRVMSNRYFAMTYLIPRLPAFMARYPKLQVNLELAERFPDLLDESIDIVFGISMAGVPTLIRRQVATARYVLCASTDYLEKYGRPQHPSDLSQHHYIAHSMRKPVNILIFNDKKEVYVEPRLSLNDSRAMCECAIQGMGIVRLHDYMVKDALEDGRLVEVLPEFSEKNQSVYLYYQQNRYLQPKIRRFIDFYVEHASKRER
jgi:DNA-binding transcriptional LysR family regulator